MELISRLRGLGPRDTPRPRTAEHDRSSLHASQGAVLIDVLKKERQILRRENVVDLTTDSMDRVKGDQSRRHRNSSNQNRAAICSHLKLVVPDHTHLQQLAEIFFQGKYLPKSPLISEGLTWCLVRASLLPVDLPSGGQVCGGSLVLGYVERGATCYEVTLISGTDVVACSRSESTGRSHESVSGIEVHSLPKVPTQVQGLDVHVGKT